MRFLLTPAVLDVAAAIREVSSSGAGAVDVFIGTVRDTNDGRRVLYLEYEAYEPLAIKTLQQIGDEARARWPAVELAVHHRTGRLAIGDASVVIAAGAAHRADAFSATRYAIERVKQIVPIWKHEHFEGGATWIEGAPADPADTAAREEALRRACV
jgi:molybdopterin synthase catalytic subunit